MMIYLKSNFVLSWTERRSLCKAIRGLFRSNIHGPQGVFFLETTRTILLLVFRLFHLQRLGERRDIAVEILLKLLALLSSLQ